MKWHIHRAEYSPSISGYANPDFSSQFTKAGAAGLFRGAYHIAIFESKSSGVDQANYFVANGGNKVNDGKTLPGAVKVGCESRLLDLPIHPHNFI